MASANVFAIHALEELRGALNRFGGEAQGSLSAAELEIRRTFDWLQERLNHCCAKPKPSYVLPRSGDDFFDRPPLTTSARRTGWQPH
ncbi:MAG: hypothetical protein CVU38_12210 [Chloroflexi bacterium HGW-Chloroflexi-1]|nr:MAG: hypothetical protein CVU38_12210 [Chloroflexi bacterium HGW-Chloroflexi-1]